MFLLHIHKDSCIPCIQVTSLIFFSMTIGMFWFETGAKKVSHHIKIYLFFLILPLKIAQPVGDQKESELLDQTANYGLGQHRTMAPGQTKGW